MTATDLLADLRAAGLTLRPEGGRLMVSPAARLTDVHRDGIRRHKGALLALVEAEGDAGPFDLPPPGEGIPAAEYLAFWAWVRSSATGASRGDRGRSAAPAPPGPNASAGSSGSSRPSPTFTKSVCPVGGGREEE